MSDLAFGAGFTISGANFRLRHLTFSYDSPPHVLDVLAGSLRTTRFIGSRSVQFHLHAVASSGSYLPPVCIRFSSLVRLSDVSARSQRRPLDSGCLQRCFGEWSDSLYKNWQRCSQLLTSRIKPPLDTEHEQRVDMYVSLALWQFTGLDATDFSKTQSAGYEYKRLIQE